MLRWRLFGVNFCIQPSFWFMNALWAYLLFGPLTAGHRGEPGLLMLILIWILVTLAAVMVHELGHVIMGRIFGQPGNITITGLGGQAVGEYGALSAWKRILVIASGPGAGFLFVAALVMVDGKYWNFCMDWLDWPKLKCNLFWIEKIKPAWRHGDSPTYTLVILLLFAINLFMNIMNLLPIIPMDGGMIFKEICCLISPRSGLKFAFIWSLLLAGGLTAYLLIVTLVDFHIIAKPFELYYPFSFPIISLVIFGSMAIQCYRAYRQLAMRDRYSEYAQDDDY